MAVQPIPSGYHTVTPYLYVGGAEKALDFYARAFGAIERYRMADPSGRIVHAEILIGNSHVMLAEEMPAMGVRSPVTLGGTSSSLLLYVNDVDALFQQAVAAGATVSRPVRNQFYGDRSGTVTDPFGHQWTLATHVEDVSSEEMNRRMAEQSK